MSGIVKPLFGTPINLAHPLSAGLVGCWLFNEGSGAMAYDSSGQQNHGTCVGMADPPTSTSGWNAGPHGGALVFKPSNNNAVSIPHSGSSLLNITGPWSCHAIVTLRGSGTYREIAMKRNIATGWAGYFFRVNSNDRIEISNLAGEPNQDIKSGNTSLSLNILYALSGTYTGTALNVYVNGILDGTIGSTLNPTLVTDAFNLGAYVGVGRYADITISAVSIYNRALNAEEIAYLYAFPYAMFDTLSYDSYLYSPSSVNYRPSIANNFYRQMRAA